MKGSRMLISLIMTFLFLCPSVLGGLFSASQLNEQIPTEISSQPTSEFVRSSPMGGSRYNIQGWVYVHINGEPYDRGYQYGYLIADEIIDLMQRWSKMILNHPRIKPIRPLLSDQQYENIAETWWQFCTSLADQMYWDTYPTEYRQELRGIAAGVTAKGLTLYGEPISYKDVLASNQMYEMLSKITDRKIRKSVHPLLSFFSLIQPTLSSYVGFSADEFISDFLPVTGQDTGHHHCSAFIATGNATKHDELIIANSMWASVDGAGMWWWSYYIAIRWNIILDVIPSNGHRFQMSCAPGYIWSDHDFYQNEEGITFIETTLPQGIWSRSGLPLAVRARTAVQYSESIDDVMRILKTDNDGAMNAVWLIGDTKTGEIARYELGLYHDALIERTTDGFQWSSNNPMDFWVRWEKMDWKLFFKQVLFYFVLGLDNYRYHTPWYLPAARDIAFEELGNKHYGNIDIDLVKEIMGADPIGTHSPDCKITSTSLLNHNGLLVHTGHPGGNILSMAYFDSPDVYYESIKPVGWVRLFGLPKDHDVDVIQTEQYCGLNPTEQWKVTLEKEQSNDFSSFSTVVNDVVYTATSTGFLYAISSEEGSILWSKKIGSNPTEPVISEHQLFIGSSDGLHLIHLGWLTTGTKPIGEVIGTPIVHDEYVYVGTKHHGVYCIHQDTGMIVWNEAIDGEVYLSIIDNELLIASAEETIYALNASNGNNVWTKKTDGIITSKPYQDDGIVFAGSWDTNLYALDQGTGSVLWKVETGWGVETTPVVADDLVIFGSHDQNVYAVSKTDGDIHWVFTCNAAIHTDPVLFQDSVLIGSDDGRLYRLDIGSGTLIWCFSPGETIQDASRNYVTTPIRSSVAIGLDELYIGALGALYSLY